MKSNRRRFIKTSFTSASALAAASFLPPDLLGNLHRTSYPDEIVVPPSNRPIPPQSIRFAVIGLNHGHIYSMVDAVIGGGGQLVSVYAKEQDLLGAFTKRYPQAKVASGEEDILNDPAIQLVASASIPAERAPLGVRVMNAGKDFMVDKPGIVTISQFKEVKKVQKKTGRIFSITYSERLLNPTSYQADELIEAGAIGKVVQTIGLGPHRMNPKSRPDWFFDPGKAGGILCDIGSHQCDQFLHYTKSSEATVAYSQIGNFNTKNYPAYQDFGDMLVRSRNASGYIRIDWFTPDGLATWGDGRIFILGTEGYIEMRKYIDIAGRKGGNHLFMANHKETKYFDCSNVDMPYGRQLVSDVINRTETAMKQEHCFLATELALTAQKQAVMITG